MNNYSFINSFKICPSQEKEKNKTDWIGSSIESNMEERKNAPGQNEKTYKIPFIYGLTSFILSSSLFRINFLTVGLYDWLSHQQNDKKSWDSWMSIYIISPKMWGSRSEFGTCPSASFMISYIEWYVIAIAHFLGKRETVKACWKVKLW